MAESVRKYLKEKGMLAPSPAAMPVPKPKRDKAWTTTGKGGTTGGAFNEKLYRIRKTKRDEARARSATTAAKSQFAPYGLQRDQQWIKKKPSNGFMDAVNRKR